jgi:redox-sensitive transcriptional activator SoxR
MRAGGCLVDTSESSAGDLAQRAKGFVSFSAPAVIKIGQPFTLSAHADIPVCTTGSPQPCISEWNFELRNDGANEPAIQLTSTSDKPSQACSGQNFGIALSSQAFDNSSLSCVAQRVGLTLEEIRVALSALPIDRAPGQKDWQRLTKGWDERLDQRIVLLEALRSGLSSCIGCGCLSLRTCALSNPDDWAATLGAGPHT